MACLCCKEYQQRPFSLVIAGRAHSNAGTPSRTTAGGGTGLGMGARGGEAAPCASILGAGALDGIIGPLIWPNGRILCTVCAGVGQVCWQVWAALGRSWGRFASCGVCIMVKILVTGTPGTGKSTVCAGAAALLRAKGRTVNIITVNDIIKSERLYDEYDAHFDTYIIDDRKVRRHLEGILKDASCGDVIHLIETHTVSALPKKIDHVVVLTARTDVLFDRLVARKYSQDKVNENMECEIMRIVLEEAVERFGQERVHEMACNTDEDMEDILSEIDSLLKL